jgi:methylisocitrate lyase
MELHTATPGARFRKALETGCLVIPGVFNALAARLAQRAGFLALYQSGAALSAGMAAMPDIGLLTATEFAQSASYLTAAVTIPVIADADTGFGEALAVERTVTLFEAAGLAGLHLEDQQSPKRCGHLSGKEVVSRQVYAAKIKAAVAARRDSDFVIIARTDARGVLGIEEALDRAKLAFDLGADLVFPEALETTAEFERFGRESPGRLIANMTEFGKSPLLSVAELGTMGYSAVLFPVTFLRVAMHAVDRAARELLSSGTQKELLDAMQTRAQLYELLNYKDFEERDRAYFG